MIYDIPPFKHTRKIEENPIKVFGKTISEKTNYPWQLLDIDPDIETKISNSAEINDTEIDTSHGPVHIGKNVRIERSTIRGPAWIGSNTEIGPYSLIRSGSIGKNCHIGHAVEIKNTCILDNSNVPHKSYIGDSIIGSDVNLGACTNVANLRHDEEPIEVLIDNERIDTNREKLGVIIGDFVKTGINTIIEQGTIVDPFVMTAPGAKLSGHLETLSLVYSDDTKKLNKEKLKRIYPDFKDLISGI